MEQTKSPYVVAVWLWYNRTHRVVLPLAASIEECFECDFCGLSTDLQTMEQLIQVTPVIACDFRVVLFKVLVVYTINGSSAVSWKSCTF